MTRNHYDSIATLETLGITYEDAASLRRISMTLHRWHELECGDSNDHSSWVIVRGEKRPPHPADPARFHYDDNGKPFIERHIHRGSPDARYEAIADREKGALKRLATIMARYPTLTAYVQGDPRGAALYILRPSDVPEGQQANAYYSRGIVVCK